ncbi:hypothetical protein D9M71_633400 [compost metagenome]
MVPGQQANCGKHHQGRLHHLPPEADQRIAQLVGVAGGAGDHLAHAVLPVIAQVQSLDLLEDAFAQAGQQVLAEHQRQRGGGILQHPARHGDGEQQPQPAPGHAGVQAAVGLADHGEPGIDIVDGVADQPLLQGQPGVAGDEQQCGEEEAPGHLAVDRQAAQQGVVLDHLGLVARKAKKAPPCRGMGGAVSRRGRGLSRLP